jgi:hypothetical protein
MSEVLLWKILNLHRDEGSMQITIDLPDDIAKHLQQQWENIPRHVLESLVLADYQARVLTLEQVRRLLGYETRFEVHGFLKEHGVSFYTEQDLENDLATRDQLGV